jgi:hypothetical protein
MKMRLPDGYTIRVVSSAYELLFNGHHVAYESDMFSRASALRRLRRLARQGVTS